MGIQGLVCATTVFPESLILMGFAFPGSVFPSSLSLLLSMVSSLGILWAPELFSSSFSGFFQLNFPKDEDASDSFFTSSFNCSLMLPFLLFSAFSGELLSSESWSSNSSKTLSSSFTSFRIFAFFSFFLFLWFLSKFAL